MISFFFFILLISSPNCLVICQLDIDLGPLPLIPDLLKFVDQRLAIVYPIIQTFKNIITSDPLGITKTWVGSDVCSYTGFYCGTPPDNATAVVIAAIDFNGFGLSAPTLDGFLDQLPDLAIFHANSNNFTGTISPKIANLRYLFELDLSNNNFVGRFPTAVLALKGLSFLDIRFNSFTGAVPSQIFMQTLDFVFLNDNNFVQTLPQTLGSTTVAYLTLANNKFTGPIPRSIGDASATLREILLLNNLLTGCVPYEIGFLKETVLFDAANNILTGPLPRSLGCLRKIVVLNFAGNLLYGNIPEEICKLRSLVNFSLSDNYFSSVGPECEKAIKSGVLDVRKNCIQGLPEQRSAAECAAFLLKPRSCLNSSSYNLLPCKVQPSSSDHERADNPTAQPQRRPKRKLVSYAALSRHRLML